MATHEAVNGVSRGDAPESRLEALDLPLYDRTAYVEGDFGAKTPFGQVDVDGNLSISSDVQDFFLLRPQAWGELRITLGDLESNAFLVLMDANGNLIESSNNAGAAEESITVEVSSSQDYYLQVGLWDTSDTRYSLKVHTPSPWEDRINGASVGDTKFPGGADVAGVLLSASDSNVLGSTGRFEDQEDVYVVTPQYSGEMSAQLRALKDDLRLVVYDADFNSLDHSVTAGTADENVSTTVVAGETYYFLIDGAYSSYILDVNTPNDPPMPPDVVPELSPGATIFNGDVGDSLNLATSIELSEHPAEPIRITGSIGYQYGDNQSDSADFYRFTPDHSGFMTVGVLTSQDGMQVILRDEQGNALEQFNASDNGYESLLYRQEVVKDQVYYIEVDGISNSTAAVYDMFIKLNFPSDKVNGNGYGEAGETFADAIDIGVEANSSTITLEGSVGFYDVNRNFDSLDYYTVKPTQSGIATITVADLEHPLTLSVLNTYGETLYSAIHNAGSSEDVELNFGQNLQYFIKAASDTGTSYRLDVSVPMGDQSGGPVSTNPPTPAALDWLLAQLNGQWQSLSAIQFDLNLFELLTQLTQGILPVGVGDDVYMPNPLAGGNVLWDVAGVDQLSLSGSSAGWHIELPDAMGGALAVGLAIPDAELQVAAHDNLLWLLGEWEQVLGSAGSDKILGNGLNNYLIGAGGNDLLDGGDGIDTAGFNGGRGGFQVSVSDQGVVVSGLEGLDQLVDIERLTFTDTNLAMDIGGHAGEVAKIIGAVFGSQAVANTHYVGIGLDYRDRGTSYEDLMVFAINERLGANASAVDIVNLLYENVVGVAPSVSEQQVYTRILTSGEMSVGELGVFAADTDLNQNNVDLVGLQTTGLAFDLV